MSAFRMYVKSAIDLAGRPIANFPLISGRFGDDCQSIYTSEFVAVDIPLNIEAGDFCGVYDAKGRILYTGIIQSIKEKTIEAKPIITFFDFDYISLYGTAGFAPNIERQIIEMLGQLLNAGGLISNIMTFKITMTAGTTTEGGVVLVNDNLDIWQKPYNMMDMLRKQENAYGVHYYWTLPFEPGKLLLNVSRATAPKATIADNVSCVYNINVGEEEPIPNWLQVMVLTNGSYQRYTYYLLKDGTYNNGSMYGYEALTFHKVTGKTLYIDTADWEGEETVKKEIPPLIYNQAITFDLVLDNNFYDFYSWQLGQEMEIWKDGRYYETVYTAWEVDFNNGEDAGIVHITCGTARSRLTEVLNGKK